MNGVMKRGRRGALCFGGSRGLVCPRIMASARRFGPSISALMASNHRLGDVVFAELPRVPPFGIRMPQPETVLHYRLASRTSGYHCSSLLWMGAPVLVRVAPRELRIPCVRHASAGLPLCRSMQCILPVTGFARTRAWRRRDQCTATWAGSVSDSTALARAIPKRQDSLRRSKVVRQEQPALSSNRVLWISLSGSGAVW